MNKKPSFPVALKHERVLWLAVVGFLLTLILFLTVIILRNNYGFVVAHPIHQKTVAQKARQFARIYGYVNTHAVNDAHLDGVFQAAIEGMLAHLQDPFAEFVIEDAAKALQSRVSGHFGGIGTVIIKHSIDGVFLDERERYVHILEVHDGSPAARAGLQPDDFITEINGIETESMDGSTVVLHLRGPVDSPVQLTILRGEDTFSVELKRDYIEINTVRKAIIDSIGYLKIQQFTNTTVTQVQEALSAFETQGATGVVIDLRDNPGGSLDAVVKIADLLLKEGVIVSTQSRSNVQNQVFHASAQGLWSERVPLVVLINDHSASASEVLAGALQDNERATVMGQVSYGKASVQQVYPLNRQGTELLKLTIAYYFTPSGQNIDGQGITPDVITVPPLPPDHSEEAYEAMMGLYGRRIFEQFLKTTPQPSLSDRYNFAQGQSEQHEALELSLVMWHLERYLSLRVVREEGYDLARDQLLVKAKNFLLKQDMP